MRSVRATGGMVDHHAIEVASISDDGVLTDEAGGDVARLTDARSFQER